nr:hypothetical protein [Tanacetum cinerariifolium]
MKNLPLPREEGQRATPMVTFTSRVLEEEEEIASYVELAKAYMASRPTYKVAPVVELAKAYRPYK